MCTFTFTFTQAEKEWEALDEKYAKQTIAKIAELQGMYVKYGQTCAGFANTFSETWLKEMRKLEDQVPAQPAIVVQQTIEEETGKPLEETFKDIDEVAGDLFFV